MRYRRNRCTGRALAWILPALLTCGAPESFAQCGAEETARFIDFDGVTDDWFGFSVDIDGDVVLVGMRQDDDGAMDAGSVFAYRRVGGQWTQEQKILAPDPIIAHRFGSTVAVSGDIALIGAPTDNEGGNNAGAVYVYTYTPGQMAWLSPLKLVASNSMPTDAFGSGKLDIDDDVAIVGAVRGDGNVMDSGTAYIYRGPLWEEEAMLSDPDGALDDGFGRSCAIEGAVAVVGAHRDDENGSESGSVFVYRFNGNGWNQEAKLTPADGQVDALFGESVSISGDVILVGSRFADGAGVDTGAAYVFRYDPQITDWTQEAKLFPADGAFFDQFGLSCSISDELVIVGAPLEDDNGNSAGAAYVFRYDGIGWTEQTKILASDGAAENSFGWSSAIDRGNAVVGAYLHDGPAQQSGAAYLFDVACGGGFIKFDDPNEVPAAGIPNIEATGFIDNDLDWDVVVALPGTDQIQVFLNNGSADGVDEWQGLTGLAPEGAGDNPSGVALGLFDNDQVLDIVISNFDANTVTIKLGNADGTFTFLRDINVGNGPSDVEAADFNDDRIADFAVLHELDNDVWIFENDGNANFTLLTMQGTGGFGPHRMNCTDIDNDKCIDIGGVNNATSDDGPGGSVFILPNLGNGTFGAAETYAVGVAPNDLSFGLLDGDAFFDIVASNEGDDTFSVLLNQGDGTFAAEPDVAVGMMPLSINAVDLDGDLDADIAVVADDDALGPAVQILRNRFDEGNGLAFIPPVGVSVDADPKFILSADFNNDMAADLVTVNEDTPKSGSVTVLLNTTFGITPASFRTVLGAYLSGSVSDLVEADDSYLVIGQRAGLSPLLPLILVEITGQSITQMASDMTVTMETAATALPGPVPMRLTLLNNSRAWEREFDGPDTTSDALREVAITQPVSRFIEPGTRLMRMRLQWFDPGNVFFPNWAARIDRATWDVTP